MRNEVCILNTTRLWRRLASGLLSASWVLGMICGFFAASSAGKALTDLVVVSTAQQMSLIGCLSVSVLPILFAAFAVSFSEPWLLLFLSTFKAFSFSFCAWGVCLAFGQCGWLVLFLFLFSDFLLIPLQFFYWLRHIRGDRIPPICELPIFLGISILVSCFDYCVIAPFLASLMIN